MRRDSTEFRVGINADGCSPYKPGSGWHQGLGSFYSWMNNCKYLKWGFILLFVIVNAIIFIVVTGMRSPKVAGRRRSPEAAGMRRSSEVAGMRPPEAAGMRRSPEVAGIRPPEVAGMRSPKMHRAILAPQPARNLCPYRTSTQNITPLNNTKHLLVSAYLDNRVKDWDLRIIGIFRRDSILPLHCFFCCRSYFSIHSTLASIEPHTDNFGFPFVTTDVMCQIPVGCDATHVTLSIHPDSMEAHQQMFLPIGNQESSSTEERRPQFNFTVCISNLFGDYNNVLQFTQALEMYRLLGVDRVVIYKTSCGSDLDRLLHSYSQEGLVEMVPWPIDKHLQPSQGWKYTEHGGELHYFGQLTTLNECIYRYMDRSRYVLLNDIDEIIVPYNQRSLMTLMNELQQQNPKAGVFLIENHIFPKHHFEPSARFHLPQWEGVPGVNILEHIYREEPDRTIYHPYKMIVQPRMVEQTSVHAVLKNFGNTFKVPPDVCRIVHVRVALIGRLTKEQLHVDTRLWDFHDKLIPNVDKVLRGIGMLRMNEGDDG